MLFITIVAAIVVAAIIIAHPVAAIVVLALIGALLVLWLLTSIVGRGVKSWATNGKTYGKTYTVSKHDIAPVNETWESEPHEPDSLSRIGWIVTGIGVGAFLLIALLGNM